MHMAHCNKRIMSCDGVECTCTEDAVLFCIKRGRRWQSTLEQGNRVTQPHVASLQDADPLSRR